MKITRQRQSPASAKSRKSGAGSGSAFTLASGEAKTGGNVDSATSAPGEVEALQGVDALLAVQGIGERKQDLAQFGNDVLDRLEEWRLSLLSGKLTSDQIHALIGALSKRPSSNDRQLNTLINEIELRARIELAKMGHFL